MPRRIVSPLLIGCGALLLALGLGALLPAGVATAQVVPQPSPRPPVSLSTGGGDSSSSMLEPGHISGTVIDTVTGAPAAGVPVLVGEVLVLTDADGNYDRWLAPGSYSVSIPPSPGQRSVVEPPFTVTVGEGGRTIQHLRFAGPSAAPQEAPQVVAAPTPEQAAVPQQPHRLPRTDGPDGGWLIACGVLLLAGGVALSVRPRRLAPASARRGQPADELLRELLAATPARRRVADDELLRRLLDR